MLPWHNKVVCQGGRLTEKNRPFAAERKEIKDGKDENVAIGLNGPFEGSRGVGIMTYESS